ncbi:MAG: hypothetical protein WA981_13900 [Glaciecola sp.]
MLKSIAMISASVLLSACLSSQPGGQNAESVEDNLMFAHISNDTQAITTADKLANTANQPERLTNKEKELVIEVNESNEQDTVEIDEDISTVLTANGHETENKKTHAIKIQSNSESLADIIVQLIETADLNDAEKAKIRAVLN